MPDMGYTHLLLRPLAEANSQKPMSAPNLRQISRKGRSVTPAMGASTMGLVSV